MIVPPYTIKKAEIDEMVDSLEETLLEVQPQMR
jgi:adenosylmethionine-8-amino-7-oxononanoate aminotransferase